MTDEHIAAYAALRVRVPPRATIRGLGYDLQADWYRFIVTDGPFRFASANVGREPSHPVYPSGLG